MPLLTYDEYLRVDHEGVHTFRIDMPQNSVFYFGERHSFNPQNPEWNEVKNMWKSLLNHPSKLKIALIEGGVRDVFPTEHESIVNDGGMGLVTWLAHQSGIEILSPEPPDARERLELEKVFSRDAIQYYYFARMVYQWQQKEKPKPDFELYITHSLERDRRLSGWSDYDFSLDAMKKIHESIFKTPFTADNSELFYDVINPARIGDRVETNEVSKRSGEIRDEYIASEIIAYAQKGYTLYVQYGKSHAIIQEPYLKEKLI